MTLNPLPLLSSAASAVTGFLGGIQTYLIIGAVALAVGGAGGTWVGYRIESGKVAAIQTTLAQAQTQVAQHGARIIAVEDKVGLDFALAHQTIDDHITLQVATNSQEITLYVHDKISCPGPTVGLARVLRAYADGIDPANLSLAPAQSDDDCSDVSASEVASWFNAYAGVARQNAQQLTDLQGWVLANQKAQETK